MNAAGLTPKMKRCKEFIAVYSEMHGISPSFQEIADTLGFKSKSQIYWLVEGLVERGHARRTRKHSRTITIIDGICPSCGRGGG